MSVQYHKEKSWFGKHKIATAFLSIIALFFIIAGIGVVRGDPEAKQTAPAVKYSATLQKDGMTVENPAALRIYAEVKNTSTVSGKPECTVHAYDDSRTYTGTDMVTRTSDLKPGGIWDFTDVLTITKQGAQYVTRVDVSCD